MIGMENPVRPYAAATVFAFVLAVIITTSGCVGMIGDTLASGHAGTEATVATNPVSPFGADGQPVTPQVPAAGQARNPAAVVTPAKSDLVTEVTPYQTPDPYPILHGTRIESSPLYNRLDRMTEYEKKFVLRGNATGLLVNVVEGPLIIVYEIDPMYDCMANPCSCRGALDKPVNRPYMTITVRDNQTQEIVAEDGFGREFSSDTGNYEIRIETDESTTTSSPGPRYLLVYKTGVFHITIEGNYLDVDLRLATGASPTTNELTIESGAVPTPEIPWEDLPW